MSAGSPSNSAQQKNNFRVNLDRCTNFMRQFRDPESRELTKLSANQFMEVWSHYDKDGNQKYSHYLKKKTTKKNWILYTPNMDLVTHAARVILSPMFWASL